MRILTTFRISGNKNWNTIPGNARFTLSAPKAYTHTFHPLKTGRWLSSLPEPWNQERSAEQKPEREQRIRKPSDQDYRRGRRQPPVRLCGYADELIGNVLDLHKLTGKEKEAERNQLIAQRNSGT